MSNNFCENCGTANEEGSKFCLVCGKTIDQEAPSATSEQTPPPSQSAQYNQAPNSSYTPPVAPIYVPTPQQNYYQRPSDNAPMTVGQFLLTMLVAGIPFVGFIMLLVWAFSSDTNINKKNYCRAVLIMGAIGVVIGIFFGIILAILIPTIMASSGFPNY